MWLSLTPVVDVKCTAFSLRSYSIWVEHSTPFHDVESCFIFDSLTFAKNFLNACGFSSLVASSRLSTAISLASFSFTSRTSFNPLSTNWTGTETWLMCSSFKSSRTMSALPVGYGTQLDYPKNGDSRSRSSPRTSAGWLKTWRLPSDSDVLITRSGKPSERETARLAQPGYCKCWSDTEGRGLNPYP